MTNYIIVYNYTTKLVEFCFIERIGIIGLSEGPPHYLFYKYLDHFLPGKATSTIAKKILLDQVLACPFFNLQFFVGMAWLEGKPLSDCWKEFLKKFPAVYLVREIKYIYYISLDILK